jgi:DNA-binding NarL/FixJ family response regulator
MPTQHTAGNDPLGSSHAARPGSEAAGVVLIVDDAPGNLATLHDALDAAGYRVLVAMDGKVALERVAHLLPDVILLDAVMPVLDGFETCRRLKAEPASAHLPVIFMTGLTDTDHILEAFRAGGVDYVTKPIKPTEVLARIETHMRNARLTTHAQQAVDATGHAMIYADWSGRVRWQSPSARQWLRPFLGADGTLPSYILQWLKAPPEKSGGDSLRVAAADAQLSLTRLASAADGVTLLVRKLTRCLEPEALATLFGLTGREADVLYWVTLGKTNRDVGEILNVSSRTVDKHLQHVFSKLNVETRTAAAALAMNLTAARS